MILKLRSVLAFFLFLISSSAFASQSYLDLGFLVPPGFFALGAESNQSWEKVSTGITTDPTVDTRVVRQDTRGFLRFGIFNDVEIKISGGQGKSQQTITRTPLLGGGAPTEAITNASGMTNPDVELAIRLIGTGETNNFNLITRVGYAPSTGDRKIALANEDGNMKNGGAQFLGALGLNLKFENSDWLLSGEYVSHAKGQATNADGTQPLDLGAYAVTTVKLNYRYNFGHVLYFDFFAGKFTSSDIVDINQTTLEETTTTTNGDSFYGAGLGLLISGRLKLEGQIQTSALKQKITRTDNSGSLALESQEDRKLNLSLSFVM